MKNKTFCLVTGLLTLLSVNPEAGAYPCTFKTLESVSCTITNFSGQSFAPEDGRTLHFMELTHGLVEQNLAPGQGKCAEVGDSLGYRFDVNYPSGPRVGLDEMLDYNDHTVPHVTEDFVNHAFQIHEMAVAVFPMQTVVVPPVDKTSDPQVIDRYLISVDLPGNTAISYDQPSDIDVPVNISVIAAEDTDLNKVNVDLSKAKFPFALSGRLQMHCEPGLHP